MYIKIVMVSLSISFCGLMKASLADEVMQKIRTCAKQDGQSYKGYSTSDIE